MSKTLLQQSKLSVFRAANRRGWKRSDKEGFARALVAWSIEVGGPGAFDRNLEHFRTIRHASQEAITAINKGLDDASGDIYLNELERKDNLLERQYLVEQERQRMEKVRREEESARRIYRQGVWHGAALTALAVTIAMMTPYI